MGSLCLCFLRLKLCIEESQLFLELLDLVMLSIDVKILPLLAFLQSREVFFSLCESNFGENVTQ